MTYRPGDETIYIGLPISLSSIATCTSYLGSCLCVETNGLVSIRSFLYIVDDSGVSITGLGLHCS